MRQKGGRYSSVCAWSANLMAGCFSVRPGCSKSLGHGLAVNKLTTGAYDNHFVIECKSRGWVNLSLRPAVHIPGTLRSLPNRLVAEVVPARHDAFDQVRPGPVVVIVTHVRRWPAAQRHLVSGELSVGAQGSQAARPAPFSLSPFIHGTIPGTVTTDVQFGGAPLVQFLNGVHLGAPQRI